MIYANKIIPLNLQLMISYLIKWVRGVAFNLGFVVIILRSDKYNGQPERKTCVLLGCERGGK